MQAMINEAYRNKKLMQLYLQEFYNLSMHYKPLAGETTASRIVNNFIDIINEKHLLPRFLMVIIDRDIISDVNLYEDDDPVKTIRQGVDWLVKQISIAIRRKRVELLQRKPGAIYGADPTVVFVRMVCRVDLRLKRGSKLDEIYALRAKFNDALNDAASRYDNRILTVNSCNSAGHFDNLGNLSEKGRKAYWQEVDDLLERFDRKAIKLLPSPVVNKASKDHRAEDDADVNRY